MKDMYDLRAALGNRGIEYEARGDSLNPTTFWVDGDRCHTAYENRDGSLRVETVTDHATIEGCLDWGTCRNVSYPPEGFLCSECGWGDFGEPSHLLTTAHYEGLDRGPRFCPNCGRRVVE